MWYPSTISIEDWYFINAVLDQTITSYKELIECAEFRNYKTPKKLRAYKVIFKDFDTVRKQLREHEETQPPPQVCAPIGHPDFNIDEHGSNLYGQFHHTLSDPNRQHILEADTTRLEGNKTGIGGIQESCSDFPTLKQMQEQEKLDCLINLFGKSFQRSSRVDSSHEQDEEATAHRESTDQAGPSQDPFAPPDQSPVASQDPMLHQEHVEWATQGSLHSPFHPEGQDAFDFIKDILQDPESSPKGERRLFKKDFTTELILP